uniref:Uncharacterized protein n=1 Tax=Arion vulgaris TaxID=1028688 RepID=A0A0B7A9Y3_9EUPU
MGKEDLSIQRKHEELKDWGLTRETSSRKATTEISCDSLICQKEHKEDIDTILTPGQLQGNNCNQKGHKEDIDKIADHWSTKGE